MRRLLVWLAVGASTWLPGCATEPELHDVVAEPAPVTTARPVVAHDAPLPTVRDVAPDVDRLRLELARDGVKLPEPLDGAPPTFVLPSDPEDPRRSCFLRLRRLTLGGEFDAFDDEDLVIYADVRGVRHELGAASIDLPAEGVETFDIPGHDWIEVPVVAEVPIVVWIVETDARRDELVARAVAQLQPALLPEGTSPVTVSLGTVRGTAWTVLGAGRPFTIHGSALELSLYCVPRISRNEASPRIKTRVQSTLGPVLDASAPRTAAGARTLVRLLVDGAGRAMATARIEADAATRGALAELAAEARRVAVLAAAAVVEPFPEMPRAQHALDEAAARCDRARPRREALVNGAALLSREPSQPLDTARISRLHADAARLLGEAGALAATESGRSGPPQDISRLVAALSQVEHLLRRTRRGLSARDQLERAWVILQARIREASR